MQKTDKEQNGQATEASFGGSRYKRNYDKYRESGTKNDAENGSGGKATAGTVVSVIAFALLFIGISLFVANTILQTKGKSLFSVFDQQTSIETKETEEITHGKVINAADVLSATVELEITGAAGTDTKYGYGIVITTDGYIVTSSSLVSGALNITVSFGDGTAAQAYTVGLDESKGVCVIKTDITGLSVAEIGDSSVLKENDKLFIAGTADDGNDTLYETSVISRETDDGSAKLRLSGILTDRAGYPLLNSSGKVVALTGGKDGPSTLSSTLAVPMSEALSSINRMITSGNAMFEEDNGTVAVAELGISVKAVTDGLAEIYNIPVGCFVVRASGVLSQVKKGDIIVSVNDTPVYDGYSLSDAILSLSSSGGNLKVYRTNGYIEIIYSK